MTCGGSSPEELAQPRRGDPRLPDHVGRPGPAATSARTSAPSSSPWRCTACSTRRATASCGTPATRPTCTSWSPAGLRASRPLRQKGGLSGYPSRAESDHDVIENSHASTSLSYADGIAKAHQLRGLSRPARRRGHRRRCADRRHGVGGDQQHRRRQGPPPRHRRQRQRAVLRADDRRPRPPSRDAAHDGRLRALPRVGQAGARPHARGRRPDLRHPARHEEGHQGRRRAAGHVRGPRAEVHRAGRRPRHRGDGARAAPGPGLRRTGARALHHAQGPGLLTTPRTTWPTTSTASA